MAGDSTEGPARRRLDALPPYLANLPLFLDRLEERAEATADLARELVARDDWRVVTFWGPEQMDVWSLVVGRGMWCVSFGIERGFADPVLVAPVFAAHPPLHPEYVWLDLAVFLRSRALGSCAPLASPADLLDAHPADRLATLDWLRPEHAPVLRALARLRTEHAHLGLTRVAPKVRDRYDARLIAELEQTADLGPAAPG